MDVDVVNSVVINRPLADVSQYAADPDHAPLWYDNIRSVEWRTPRPVQVRSQIDFGAQFLGRRLAYTYEVVEFVPGRRRTMRTPGPPFLLETTYTWENQDGATRMTLRNRGTPSGFSAWLAPLMSFMIGRANRKDLSLLKDSPFSMQVECCGMVAVGAPGRALGLGSVNGPSDKPG